MKQYTSTYSKFTAVAQLDDNGAAVFGYTMSDSALVIQSAVAATTVFHFTVGGGLPRQIDYVSDPNGKLVVSMRKFYEATGNGNYCTMTISATIDGVADSLYIPVNVKSGVSYCDIVAPRQKEMSAFDGGLSPHSVVPPNVIVVDSSASVVVAESSLSNIAIPSESLPSAVWKGQVSGQSMVAITLSGTRNNQVEINTGWDMLHYIGSTTRTWNLVRPSNCGDVALCQWTSRTGAVRRHFLFVKDLELIADSSVTLSNPGDGIAVAKNSILSFKVWLDGLTNYSAWYYADLAMASDLHVAVGDQIPFIDSEMNAAYCTDTKKNMPSRVGFTSFEATIRYRKNDTY